MELAVKMIEFLATHSIEIFLGVFVLALLWLVTLSDWFCHRFGGLDLWINDIQRGRLVQCYRSTTTVLAALIVVTNVSAATATISGFLCLLVFVGTISGNNLLWRLGLLAQRFPGIGSVRYHRRIAIVSLATFALCFGIDSWVTTVRADSSVRMRQPAKSKETPTSVPLRRDNVRRVV